MMQIVIDIDKEYSEFFIEKYPQTIMAEAIKNGTPLPKGIRKQWDCDYCRFSTVSNDGIDYCALSNSDHYEDCPLD